MPRLSIFCLTSFLCLAPTWASSGQRPWRANPLRPPTEALESSAPPAADSTPRIQIQQPRDRSAEADQRDADGRAAEDREVADGDMKSPPTAAAPAEEPAVPATDRDREITAVPSAMRRLAQPTASQRRSNLQSMIRRLPSVFAPPPVAGNGVSGLQLGPAKSRSAPGPPASLPAAPTASISTDAAHHPIASPPQQSAIIGLEVSPSEAPAEKPTWLWQRFVRFPKQFKKPSREPPPRQPVQDLATHSDAAATEQETSQGNWFGSFGKGLMRAPPPPQWMQDRMAEKNLTVAGDE